MKSNFPSDWGFVEWSISLAIAGFSVVTAYITKVQLGLWSYRRDIIELQNDVKRVEIIYDKFMMKFESAYKEHPTRADLDAHIVMLQNSIDKLQNSNDKLAERIDNWMAVTINKPR